MNLSTQSKFFMCLMKMYLTVSIFQNDILHKNNVQSFQTLIYLYFHRIKMLSVSYRLQRFIRKKESSTKVKLSFKFLKIYFTLIEMMKDCVLNFKQKIDFLPNQFFTLQHYETFYEHLQHFVKLSFFINSFPFVRRDLVENCNKNVKS